MKTVYRIVLIVVFLIFVWLTHTFGQNTVKLDDFDAVLVTGDIELVLMPGNELKAEIDARNISDDEVKVRVVRGVLKVQVINSLFVKDDDVTVTVYYKNLRAIKGLAGAKIKHKGVISGDKLLIDLNSGAYANLEVSLNAFEGSASEGAVLKVKGTSTTQTANASSGARYDGVDLTTERAYAKAGTGGTVKIMAKEFLEATANTGGIIEYSGAPKEREIRTLLGGSIVNF